MRVCLSSIEWDDMEYGLALARMRPSSVLVSFYYAGYNTRSDPDRLIYQNILAGSAFRLADSGAYTMLSAAKNGGKLPDLRAYVEQYKAWIRRMRQRSLIDYWVELDVGAVAGRPWLDKHRVDMVASGLGDGLVRVWHHRDHSQAEWVDLLEEARLPGRSRLVAIESRKVSGRDFDFGPFLKQAWDRGVRVHGFAVTGYRDLIRFPFYSVDSSSWLYPAINGHLLTTAYQYTSSGGVKSSGKRVPIGSGTCKSRFGLALEAAKKMIDMERRVTDIWRSRGVDWDVHEPPHMLRSDRDRDQRSVGQELPSDGGADRIAPQEPLEP